MADVLRDVESGADAHGCSAEPQEVDLHEIADSPQEVLRLPFLPGEKCLARIDRPIDAARVGLVPVLVSQNLTHPRLTGRVVGADVTAVRGSRVHNRSWSRAACTAAARPSTPSLR